MARWARDKELAEHETLTLVTKVAFDYCDLGHPGQCSAKENIDRRRNATALTLRAQAGEFLALVADFLQRHLLA